jgi:tetratricopeptide (TPR) repeat protein/predicted Ser/Thr protein kinase
MVNQSAEQRSRVETIFHEVIEAREDQRTTLIELLCRGDSTLIDELKSLVESSQAEETLSAKARDAAPSISPGRRIGPYELDRLLGRGGMGAVYLAHRVDGAFEQHVAVKLIDLPLAGDFFREQFRMERQILAGLVHPYIARLLDGGVSEHGELYLAMEYVDGVSIMRYCKQNQLPLRARLQLFKKVCEAVHYAHQNLVVHRDLKPDNILVVADGTPRLLDFGTAKLLTPVPASGEFTLLGVQSFTPQYASPEQVMGKPISTASDIYSLGVLLYLMLAEVPPYELKEFTTESMLRVICAEEPPRPSSKAVSAEPPDADLDAITLKALRKEPQNRYISADQLGEDVLVYLNGRPVQARRGTLRYRAGKFAKRNKLLLSAAALLLATLVAGFAIVLWQFRATSLERRRAEARSEDLQQLSNSLLSEIDEAVKELPGSTSVRQLLVQRVLQYLDRMSKDEAGDRTTQLDLIAAYTRLGNLQGNPYDQNIGDSLGALASLDKALAIGQTLKSKYPHDAAVLGAIALAQKTRSNVLFGISRTTESIAAMRAAIEAFDAQFALSTATPAQLTEEAGAYNGLGDQLGLPGVASLGDSTGALDAYGKAVELSRRALAIDPKFTRARRTMALGHSKIAYVETETDPAAGVAEYEQSLAAWSELVASGDTSTTTGRNTASVSAKLGVALSASRDYKAALIAFERAGKTFRAYAAADRNNARAGTDLFALEDNEAHAYIDMLNPQLNPNAEDREQNLHRAMDLLQDSINVIERLLAIDPGNRIWITNLANEKVLLGTLEQKTANSKGGAQLASSGIATLNRLASAKDATIDVLDVAVASSLEVSPKSLRNSKTTVSNAERLVALENRKNPDDILLLAQAYRADGQFAKAVATAREGLALLPATAQGTQPTRTRKLLEIEVQNNIPAHSS